MPATLTPIASTPVTALVPVKFAMTIAHAKSGTPRRTSSSSRLSASSTRRATVACAIDSPPSRTAALAPIASGQASRAPSAVPSSATATVSSAASKALPSVAAARSGRANDDR